MPTPEKPRTIWALLGVLCFLLCNYPLLQMANRPVLAAGVPLLVWYLHVVWIAAILALYLLSRWTSSRE
jgi:hypothetical protein